MRRRKKDKGKYSSPIFIAVRQRRVGINVYLRSELSHTDDDPIRYHYTASPRVGDFIFEGQPGTTFYAYDDLWCITSVAWLIFDLSSSIFELLFFTYGWCLIFGPQKLTFDLSQNSGGRLDDDGWSWIRSSASNDEDNLLRERWEVYEIEVSKVDISMLTEYHEVPQRKEDLLSKFRKRLRFLCPWFDICFNNVA